MKMKFFLRFLCGIPLIISGLFGLAILLVIVIQFSSSFKIAAMSDRDYAFVNKIKSNFISNSKLKVSDFHPGKWEKVCASSLSGHYGDIRDYVERFSDVDAENIQFIKNSSSRTYFNDDVWLLYFFYPPKSIEVYVIESTVMGIRNNYKVDKLGCAKKENAYFIKGNYYRTDWNEYSETIDPIKDRFILSIIEAEES